MLSRLSSPWFFWGGIDTISPMLTITSILKYVVKRKTFFFHNALKLQYLRINQQVTATPELHKWVPLLRGLGHQPTCWLVPFVNLAQRNTARRHCLSKYNFGQCQCNVTLNLSNKHSHGNLCIWIQAKGYFGKCIFWKERWSIVNLKQY